MLARPLLVLDDANALDAFLPEHEVSLHGVPRFQFGEDGTLVLTRVLLRSRMLL